MLSSFVGCEARILRVGPQLLRAGCVVVGPPGAEVVLVPEPEGAEGDDQEGTGQCYPCPDSFRRFHRLIERGHHGRVMNRDTDVNPLRAGIGSSSERFGEFGCGCP